MNCPCGQPLHYRDLAVMAYVEEMIRTLGERIKVTVGRRSWMVSRHFIALHGLQAAELPLLAVVYGFEEVLTKRDIEPKQRTSGGSGPAGGS